MTVLERTIHFTFLFCRGLEQHSHVKECKEIYLFVGKKWEMKSEYALVVNCSADNNGIKNSTSASEVLCLSELHVLCIV